ncbi:MAG TPA: hypothetical protein EYP10_11925 [Armatimonadetes bacterium]|nr:hypothetical protein [Armatimonadota bacterium]
MCATNASCTDWNDQLRCLIKAFGHRNWVLVADSAYPMLASPGVITLVTDTDHIEVVRQVLDAIEASPHLRPIIHLDAELMHVAEDEAPGITTVRQQLNQLLNGKEVRRVLHEELIHRVDEAARLFQVLVLKTTLTLPYTTVFFELDCGYWDADREHALRERIM